VLLQKENRTDFSCSTLSPFFLMTTNPTPYSPPSLPPPPPPPPQFFPQHVSPHFEGSSFFSNKIGYPSIRTLSLPFLFAPCVPPPTRWIPFQQTFSFLGSSSSTSSDPHYPFRLKLCRSRTGNSSLTGIPSALFRLEVFFPRVPIVDTPPACV